ncbi:MAG TPA: hypothetical protein VFN95_01715 [Flavitalea sp.]|nr:hypothetical protein [Flavitalea sp.]
MILLILIGSHIQAQDFRWWASVVKWDGISPWQRYIITNPGYLGPNALPVPFISNGSIDSVNSIALTGNFHFSKGDNTQNLGVYGNYCLVKDVISFDFLWVPYERYQMSHAIKEKRHVFSHYYYDNSAQGEIHLNTNIQLLRKWRDWVHLALRIGYRLPTSSGLGSARFTDAPGYYFDLSFAKPFSKESCWKMIGMAGLYVWQTNLDGRRQNDAFLFGGGMEWNPPSWRVQLYGTGYLGYMDDLGDKPVLIRAGIEQKGKRINGILKFQHGLFNFDYSSVEAGLKYTFKTN